VDERRPAAPEAAPATALEAAAQGWIEDYFNARHLVRTRDWLVALDPRASEALRIAALTHDIERRVPGGPRLDPRTQAWDDAEYLRAHAERSAGMVRAWLAEQGAPAATVDLVGALVARHETGGGAAGDLLQAADSLSFLEVNAGRALAWVETGRCDAEQAQAKVDWMRDRVGVPAARPAAGALHRIATAALRPEQRRGGR
jgi:uncharacterized protein DUF4202